MKPRRRRRRGPCRQKNKTKKKGRRKREKKTHPPSLKSLRDRVCLFVIYVVYKDDVDDLVAPRVIWGMKWVITVNYGVRRDFEVKREEIFFKGWG